MKTPAIHQAMRLINNPEEMAWLFFPDSDLPEGITDLLRLCSSTALLHEFSEKNGFDSEQLSKALFNFIEAVMLNENNSDDKILGCDTISTSQLHKFHYQLLMKIYHPDNSGRAGAEYYSSIITQAYQQQKEEHKSQDAISISQSRIPPQSYYQATSKTETQISHTKTFIAVLSVLTICVLVAMTGRFYDPANPELVNANNAVLNNTNEAQTLTKISSIMSDDIQNIEIKVIKATSTKLQHLLKKLETAYEEGNVSAIKPILANAPEIKNQSDKELSDKLETLFEITTERKMVLFDFDWTSVTGTLQGKGRFLSRYQLVGEKKWLTREGLATVSAEKVKGKLKITQLILDNKSID